MFNIKYIVWFCLFWFFVLLLSACTGNQPRINNDVEDKDSKLLSLVLQRSDFDNMGINWSFDSVYQASNHLTTIPARENANRILEGILDNKSIGIEHSLSCYSEIPVLVTPESANNLLIQLNLREFGDKSSYICTQSHSEIPSLQCISITRYSKILSTLTVRADADLPLPQMELLVNTALFAANKHISKDRESCP
jgi:hypothetical protein